MPHLQWVEIHAGINHLSFAFLLVIPIFEIGAILFHKKEWRMVSFWLLVAAVAALVPTLITGWITGDSLNFTGSKAAPPAIFLQHRFLAFVTTTLAAILLIWRVIARDQLHGNPYIASLALAIITAGTVGATGFLGGRMVLGSGDKSTFVPIDKLSPEKRAKIPQLDPTLIAQGEKLFKGEGSAQLPCQSCHTMNGAGGKSGPDLTHEAQHHNDPAWHIAHLKDPTILTKDSGMPSFDYLSPEELNALAAFLATRQ